MKKAFIVLNPVAGQSEPQVLEEKITELARQNGWDARLHRTAEGESLDDVIRHAGAEGIELFVAGGGDGTVSAVAGALVDSDLPMAILPVGTGNVLARALDVPTDPEQALQLAFGPHQLVRLDGLRANGRLFLLNVSAGPIASTMRDVDADDKRRLGFVAYVVKGARRLMGHDRRRFRITVDGQEHQVVASEAMVLNSPAFGSPHLAIDPEVQIDDGRVEVYLLRVRTPGDYLRLAWDALLAREPRSRVFRRFVASEQVSIASQPSLPVQGDGDYIGRTPIDLRVLPGAARIAVPIQEEDGPKARGE